MNYQNADVAQLDRVIRCQRIGCGIVPHHPLQKKGNILKKLKILEKEINILNIKTIESENKTIFIEEKPKGLVILVSKNIIENIDNLKGFKIVRENENRYIELIGLDIKLELNIVTQLKIDKQLLFIEEIKDNIYRLTYSKKIIEDITKIEMINII